MSETMNFEEYCVKLFVETISKTPRNGDKTGRKICEKDFEIKNVHLDSGTLEKIERVSEEIWPEKNSKSNEDYNSIRENVAKNIVEELWEDPEHKDNIIQYVDSCLKYSFEYGGKGGGITNVTNRYNNSTSKISFIDKEKSVDFFGGNHEDKAMWRFLSTQSPSGDGAVVNDILKKNPCIYSKYKDDIDRFLERHEKCPFEQNIFYETQLRYNGKIYLPTVQDSDSEYSSKTRKECFTRPENIRFEEGDVVYTGDDPPDVLIIPRLYSYQLFKYGGSNPGNVSYNNTKRSGLSKRCVKYPSKRERGFSFIFRKPSLVENYIKREKVVEELKKAITSKTDLKIKLKVIRVILKKFMKALDNFTLQIQNTTELRNCWSEDKLCYLNNVEKTLFDRTTSSKLSSVGYTAHRFKKDLEAIILSVIRDRLNHGETKVDDIFIRFIGKEIGRSTLECLNDID